MLLKPPLRKQLQRALLGVFPRRADLKALLKQHLNQDLDKITQAQAPEDVVEALWRWAEPTGWVTALVLAACAAAPNDPALRKLAAGFRLGEGSDRGRDVVKGLT
jgi:hypothetical protein